MRGLLFASDSFKGSLSSRRIGELLTEEAQRVFPDATCTTLLMADGGEGTVDAVLAATGGERVEVEVTGPMGEPVTAAYGMLSSRRAVIELAASSGLTLVPAEARDPEAATTRGFGELILDALDRGATDIYLAIGGSATNDGGMGALAALGAVFTDVWGRELAGCGADLALVEQVRFAGMDPRISTVDFTVMSDVTNPLLGEKGATRVFGPQKGADAAMLERLEAGMANYARCLETAGGRPVAEVPGAGAAGGMGAAAFAALGARMASGVDCLLDLAHFDELLQTVDVCISGEGHADAQSVDGKVLCGLGRRCKAAGVPLIAIVGGADAGADALLDMGVSRIVACTGPEVALEDALAHAEENYRAAAAAVMSELAARDGEGENAR